MINGIRGNCGKALVLVVLGGLMLPAFGADPADGKALRPAIQQTRRKALDYLRTKQADDGSFTSPNAPGIAGLVVTAALRNGMSPDDPLVQKGFKYLQGLIQKDGGIYFPESTHRNYETAIALLAFHEANQGGKYDTLIANAEKFLRKQQWDEDEGKDKTDPEYGGAGYGSKSRPDLSNTQFLLEALKAAGVKSDDPAMQKALVFVSRSQNLESEANTTPFAAKVNDGGFYYTPAAGGASMAGTTDNGGLRSYASMTYAGLKSMIYAGLDANDPRVKAAFTWIQKHYTLESNPGLDQQGLYYYYHTFAKALDALGRDQIEDAAGKKHDWRRELATQLIKVQKENGSWVNDAPRWNEGDPNLATAYALLALSYCDPQPARK
jgi:squalene-hopene/tetraprenyl-beta-curcumene cyclase